MPAIIALAAQPASGQGGLFDLLDLRTVDRSEILVREIVTDPPIVRDSEVFLAVETAPPSPDPSLAKPVSQLGLDAAGMRRIPTTSFGLQSRVAAPLIELTVAGYPLRLAVAEQKTDRDFDAVHYTLLATDSDDHARLTVSQSGPEIVGTVFIGDDEYRILPDRDDYQLVYPVVAYSRAWRRELAPDYESRTGLLEARHLQVGWVADQHPGNFGTRIDGRPHTYADGPSLGKFNFWSAFEFNPAGEGTVDETVLAQEFEIFLNGLSHFTWIHDPIAIRIDEFSADDVTTISNDGIAISGYQLINDIPISERLVLRMAPSADVIEFSGTLMRYDMAPPTRGEVILAPEARETSRIALRDTYRVEATDNILEEALGYQVVSQTELELTWRFLLQTECGIIFLVEIDAVTAEPIRVVITDAAGFTGRNTEDIIFQCRFLPPRLRPQ
ncbi:MAG: hypothetical protein PVH89_10525 [Gammaproteobacteria bacterium]|jgi:hypothetical protein